MGFSSIKGSTFCQGASGSSEIPDLGISLAHTGWLWLGSLWKEGALALCRWQNQTAKSTVSIDSEKRRAIKGYFPKEESFLLSAF
jgi:hypothetical protein